MVKITFSNNKVYNSIEYVDWTKNEYLMSEKGLDVSQNTFSITIKKNKEFVDLAIKNGIEG